MCNPAKFAHANLLHLKNTSLPQLLRKKSNSLSITHGQKSKQVQ